MRSRAATQRVGTVLARSLDVLYCITVGALLMRFVTVSGDNRNNFYRAPRVRLVHQHRVASPFQQ
jgi:hypothetical protein